MKKILFSSTCLLIVFFMMTAMVAPMGYDLKVVSFSPKPIVKGNINGMKTYFLLDTGADVSLLNANAEKDFGFKIIPVIGENEIQGVQGSQHQVKAAKSIDIYLGPQKIKNRILAFDLDHIVRSVQQKTGVKISGIIGSDIMRKYGFVIDYSTHKVSIQKTR